MKSFVFHPRTRVVFGEGTVSTAAEHLEFAKRFLVVTGRGSAVRHGHLDRLLGALSAKECIVYSNISANPRVSEVLDGASLANQSRSQVVIGLGGGSAMDAAKGVAVAAGAGDSFASIFANDLPAPPSTLPIVAVPTTAGTGSETSKAAILSDESAGIKKGLRGDHLLPSVAIVDPELTYSMPKKTTAETGFDIFTHAVETWVSKKSNLLTAMYSREAIKRVVKWLPIVLEAPSHIEGRRELMLASMLMGINLAHSSTCLPHRLQYPIGARTDTSHPAGLAAIYPAWFRQTLAHAPEVFEEIACLCGESDPVRAIEQLLTKLDLLYKLTDLGVDESMCRNMVSEVSGSLANDPGDTSTEALLKIYLCSL